MSDTLSFLTALGLTIITAPVVLLCVFFMAFLMGRRLREVTTGHLVQGTIVTGLTASILSGMLMLRNSINQHTVVLGDWTITPSYHLKLAFVLDPLSLSYVTLTFLLCGTIGAFSTRYLHREPGYFRFFVLFAVFLVGMVTASLSDTVETLFAGWEMVGLSSVLLIAFFHERPSPPRNGLRVWIVYRLCDVSLLLAAILMHEINGGGDFDHLVGQNAWPAHDPLPFNPHFTLLGVLFVIAAAGKSALIPFSGWLPRAMEGPTPSSAVFYGALSVHLGAFLLLRISPVLDSSLWLSGLVVLIGLLTSAFAYVTGRVQTDIKSALAFASLTQVGLIIAEIGLGFRYLALLHLLGHACLRTLQFLRAPSLLHDHHQLENAIGARPRDESVLWEQRLPLPIQQTLYRIAQERGYLDSFLERWIARPFTAFFQSLHRQEERLANRLDGHPKENVPTRATRPQPR